MSIVHFIHYLLMGMLSLTTVASFDSVGAILVVAMLIVPGATAYLLTDKLSVMLMISALVGVLSAFAGYFIATIFNVSISGSMAVAAGVIFAITFVLSPTHGLLSRWLARKRLQNKSA